jgi:membrane associated rhomboid family serine protease
MKLQYNAPLILSLTFAAVGIKAINDLLLPTLIYNFFTLLPYADYSSFFTYMRFFSHVLGHATWPHLIGNFTFILLIGPMLEEKYGWRVLLIMMALTALATAILNSLLFNTGLLGASGIAFMLILLSSFTNLRSGRIPLTFILVAFLFIGSEFANSFRPDNISQFAHILGGAAGTLFGFLIKNK